jgi:hypothetical protein
MSNSPSVSADDLPHPIALLVATTWWSAPAKLAISLAQHGCRVEVICPPDHPFHFVDRVARIHPYNCFDTLASLSAAIASSKPNVLIPCDDGAVWQLHELHRAEPDLRLLIEISIGSAQSYAAAPSRGCLMHAATKLNIRTPATLTIASITQLREWFAHPGASGVLKLDRSYGGSGVFIAHSWSEAERAYAALLRPVSLAAAWIRWLAIKDLLAFWNRKRFKERNLTLQRFIPGRPANTMFVCRDGKVLAMLTVEVLSTDGPTGSALVVRVIENGEIRSAAEKLAAEFKLSGFHGLDFMLEDHSGLAYLIEWNARCTQLGHLNIEGQQDLAGVFCQEFLSLPRGARERGISEATIAFFPQALLAHHGPFLEWPTYLDVPWQEPRLVRESIRQDWRQRRWIGRILLKLRSRGRTLSAHVVPASRGKSALTTVDAEAEGPGADTGGVKLVRTET